MPNAIKRMTRSQCRYFFDRFDLFMSQRRMADALDVSLLTVRRWRAFEIMPPLDKLEDFNDALMEVAKTLNRKAKRQDQEFMRVIADAILFDDVPEWDPPAIRKPDTKMLSDMLIDMLYGGGEVKSTKIFGDTLEMGYTRMQVYHMAKKLGVRRRHVKAGRNGYSLWRMPKETSHRGE